MNKCILGCGVGRLLLEGEWEAQEQVSLFPIGFQNRPGRWMKAALLPNIEMELRVSFLVLRTECLKRKILLSIHSYT